MKKWQEPKLKSLCVESTKEDFVYDCMLQDNKSGWQKPSHRHCPVCGESSSSCDHIDWTPIGPSTPITPPTAS